MENYIQADEYELWMIIENGPYIPMKTTEDGKTAPKKPNEFDSDDFKKMEKNARAKNLLYLVLEQTSTPVSQSVSPRRRYGMPFAWLMKKPTRSNSPRSSW